MPPPGARCRWPRRKPAAPPWAARASPGSWRPTSPAQQYERARKAAAALIGAEPDDVALISSVGYGVATAGKSLQIPRGSRVIVLENDHTSPVLEWIERAPSRRLHGRHGEAARRRRLDLGGAGRDRAHGRRAAGAGLDLLGALVGRRRDRPGAHRRPRSRSRAPRCWSTPRTMPACGTIDVKTLDPDFLIFPTYKWVLGPYGRAFMYVAKRRQNGVPLEQTASARKGVSAEDTIYFRDTSYRDDARRYDMGERDHFITHGDGGDRHGDDGRLGQRRRSSTRLSMLTGKLADGLGNLGVAPARSQAARPARSLRQLPQGHGARPAQAARRARTCMPRRGSAGCASARTSTTTSRTSSASSTCSARSRSRNSS